MRKSDRHQDKDRNRNRRNDSESDKKDSRRGGRKREDDLDRLMVSSRLFKQVRKFMDKNRATDKFSANILEREYVTRTEVKRAISDVKIPLSDKQIKEILSEIKMNRSKDKYESRDLIVKLFGDHRLLREENQPRTIGNKEVMNDEKVPLGR